MLFQVVTLVLSFVILAKKNVMQTLFEAPTNFTDLEQLSVALTNTNDVSLVYG